MAGELDRAREEIAQAGREALADVQRAADETMGAIIRVVEQQTGLTLVPPAGPSIMDATREQLGDAEYRARAALAAVDLIRGWFWPKNVATLGEFVRGLPEDVREQIADNLVKAGLS